MSSEVKRWTVFDASGVSLPMIEVVPARAYDALKAELVEERARLERVKQIATDRTEAIIELQAERDTLAAQVRDLDRLTSDQNETILKLRAQVERVKALRRWGGDRPDGPLPYVMADDIDAALAAPSVPTRDGGRLSNPNSSLGADQPSGRGGNEQVLPPVTTRPGPSPVGGTVDELRNLCAEVLDNLAAAANGTPLPHKTVIPFDGGATGEAGYTGPERRVDDAYIGFAYAGEGSDTIKVYARGPQRALHANTRAAKEGGK